MDIIVSLKEVVDGMEFQSDELTVYLNRKTGEIVMITDDLARLADREDFGEKRLPDWQRETPPS